MDNPQLDSSPKMQQATNSNEKVASDTASDSESGASSGSLAEYPMDNNYEYVHGAVDPAFEESIHLVEGIAVQKSLEGGRHNLLSSLNENEERTVTPYYGTQGMSHAPTHVFYFQHVSILIPWLHG